MQYWKKLGSKEIRQRIESALNTNINYEETACLGIPASILDKQLFESALPAVQEDPLLRVYLHNPNHIGCHTFGDSEAFFEGTQALERELIELLATDLLKGEKNSTDGYVAAGGTEANLQAVWVYRNYYLENFSCTHDEIVLVSSADTHYSIHKAANLLHLDAITVPVDAQNRKIQETALSELIDDTVAKGKKYFIVIANMGTTMFGSVDDPAMYASELKKRKLPFFIHVDGAFGGFVYPMSTPASNCFLNNPDISSITLDAHKMLQAPYGTGIFLVRKGLIQNVLTKKASYISGFDLTVNGSRSGANAVAVWLLLFSYGPFGWLEKINKLLYRTEWLCNELHQMGVRYFNEPGMNIVTIDASFVPAALAHRYGLVPDDHEKPNWYKVVVMDHVNLDSLNVFLSELAASRKVEGRLEHAIAG